MEKLREVFDDTWLWENAGKGFVHPLLSYIVNYAPWSQLWLAEFGRRLAALREVFKLPELEELKKRLKDAKEYVGAEAEVEIIVKLVAAGITDIELHPKILVRNKEKRPDLRVTVDGEDFYFEVASLGESEESRKAWETHSELSLDPFDPELIRFLQVHKPLSKPHRNDLKTKILQANRKVKDTKEHRYVGESGVLDYLVVHQTKQAECDTLVRHYGMKKENTGPPVERDDIKRLVFRFQKKSEQLPQERPAVIVLFANLIYFGSPASFYEDLVYQVEETIYDQDNLIAGVIISKVGELVDAPLRN